MAVVDLERNESLLTIYEQKRVPNQTLSMLVISDHMNNHQLELLTLKVYYQYQISTPKKKGSQDIEVKSEEAIAKMRAAGKAAREVLDIAGRLVKEGVTTDEIDTC